MTTKSYRGAGARYRPKCSTSSTRRYGAPGIGQSAKMKVTGMIRTCRRTFSALARLVSNSALRYFVMRRKTLRLQISMPYFNFHCTVAGPCLHMSSVEYHLYLLGTRCKRSTRQGSDGMLSRLISMSVFARPIEAGRRSSIEISDRNLLFNYRSNAGIVRFCNLLQLARSALLGRSDIRPQEYWAPDDPMPAKWFALDDPATESYLRDHPELIKLVDCHEGEETKYVEEDEVLHRVVDRSEEGTYRNIMCPARVKGLEFSGVVLYRFGENMAHDFERLRAGLVDLEDPQTQLPWEYFFNRLYVAASRSRTRLIVVDSKETIKLFWRVATDPDIHDFLLNKIHDRSMWEGAFAPLLPGTPGDWAGEAVDQRAQADSFATQGLRERDPYLLRQAGLSYRSVDDDYKARRCFAQAAEVEEKWDTARRQIS